MTFEWSLHGIFIVLYPYFLFKLAFKAERVDA